MTRTGNADTLCGEGGNDPIDANGGDHPICGGNGDDPITETNRISVWGGPSVSCGCE